MSDDGYILPESYIPIQFVERVFRTPSRMNYFLNNSSKAKARMNQQEAALPSFRDQTIISAIPELCRSLFRIENLNMMAIVALSVAAVYISVWVIRFFLDSRKAKKMTDDLKMFQKSLSGKAN